MIMNPEVPYSYAVYANIDLAKAYQASGEHHFAVLVHTTEEAIVKYNCKCGRSSPSNCMQPSQLLRHCTHLHLRPTKEDGIYLHTNNTTANFLVTSCIGKLRDLQLLVMVWSLDSRCPLAKEQHT